MKLLRIEAGASSTTPTAAGSSSTNVLPSTPGAHASAQLSATPPAAAKKLLPRTRGAAPAPVTSSPTRLRGAKMFASHAPTTPAP